MATEIAASTADGRINLTAAAATPAPRVIPYLCQELLSKGCVARHMNLLMFQERWRDTSKVRITDDDAEELLMILFICMKESGNEHAEAGGEVAFAIMHSLFCEHHPHAKHYIRGLLSIMHKLQCDNSHFYERAPPISPPEDYRLTRKLVELQAEREKAERREKLKEDVRAAQKSLTLADIEIKDDGDEVTTTELHQSEMNAVRIIEDIETGLGSAGQLVESLLRETAADRIKILKDKLNNLVIEAETNQKPLEEIENEVVMRQGKQPTAVEQQPAVAPEIYFSQPLSDDFPKALTQSHMELDRWLEDSYTRAFCIDLLKCWDYSGINVHYFMSGRDRIHLYIPSLHSSVVKVYRDFAFCSQRPKGSNSWGPKVHIHIKTNIKQKSDIMYRFLLEGYNYGTNSIIHSDVSGYAHRKWSKLGRGAMEDAGWPDGWDNNLSRDYMSGGEISQYYSSDGFVVLRLSAKSFFCVGFSVSAWLVVLDFGAGHQLTAEIIHQNPDL